MKSILRCIMFTGLLLAGPAQAQHEALRPIPADAYKADMLVSGERTLLLNGKEFRLSPGGQIFNQKNMITLTQALAGNKYAVRVKFNQQGEAHRVWILTAAEDAVAAPKLTAETAPWWWPF